MADKVDIKSVDDITDEAAREAVKPMPDAVKEQMRLIRENPHSIWLMKDPPGEVQLEAIRLDPTALWDIPGIADTKVVDELMSDPLRYIREFRNKECMCFDEGSAELISEYMDYALDALEEEGMVYCDEETCVICIDEGITVKEGAGGNFEIGFDDVKLGEGMKNAMPEYDEYTSTRPGNTYFAVPDKDGGITLYRTLEMLDQPKDGSVLVEKLGENMSCNETLDMIEKDSGRPKNSVDVFKMQDMRKSTAGRIGELVQRQKDIEKPERNAGGDAI